MINKKVFEEDIISSMQRNLESKTKESAIEKLAHAVEYLNSAAEILDNANFQKESEKIINILAKIAKSHVKKPKDPRKISDRHTKGLTPEKMVENLKHHGIVFNLADDGQITVVDNSNNEDKDIDDLINDEPTFEEEI